MEWLKESTPQDWGQVGMRLWRATGTVFSAVPFGECIPLRTQGACACQALLSAEPCLVYHSWNYRTMCYRAYCRKIWCSESQGLYILSHWQRILKGLELKLELALTLSGEKATICLSILCVVWLELRGNDNTGALANIRGQQAKCRVGVSPASSWFCLPVPLTLTVKVCVAPHCILLLISPKASSTQTAGLGWVMRLCFLIWFKLQVNLHHLHWWTWLQAGRIFSGTLPSPGNSLH